MVILAAAIITKSGKVLMSRQFVDLAKARIEGLLTAFTKQGPDLAKEGAQHTFFETQSVRYLYLPMEDMYMVLICTRKSNIVEDLDTLNVFTKLVSEYCAVIDEKSVLNSVWELVFAFDEVVTMGYREKVSVPQIKNYLEMESHSERLHEMDLEAKKREARKVRKQKETELREQRISHMKSKMESMYSDRGPSTSSSSASSSSYGGGREMNESRREPFVSASSSSSSSPASGAGSYGPSPVGKGLVLGAKKKQREQQVIEQLIGLSVSEEKQEQQQDTTVLEQQDTSQIETLVQETFNVRMGSGGGLKQDIQVTGEMIIRVIDQNCGTCILSLDNSLLDEAKFQFCTHPQIDKARFFSEQRDLAARDSSRPFPEAALSVLIWRRQSDDENLLPLTVSCWPSPGPNGTTLVNLEYELKSTTLNLFNVEMRIPVPAVPVVSQVDGEYNHDHRQNVLLWNIALIDASNASGYMEFSVPGSFGPPAFSAIQVSFHSPVSLAGVKVVAARLVSGESISFSSKTQLQTNEYVIE